MRIKSICCTIATFAMLIIIHGCNSNQGKQEVANGDSILSPAIANADTVNASTKVLASNVIVDPKFMNISTTNLQTALETIKPSTLSMITGTWNTYSYSNVFRNGTTGSVTFNANGTFVINNGVNAFWAPNDLTGKTGKWGLERGVLIHLSLDGVISDVYPFILTSDTNKFVLVTDVRSVIFEKAR